MIYTLQKISLKHISWFMLVQGHVENGHSSNSAILRFGFLPYLTCHYSFLIPTDGSISGGFNCLLHIDLENAFWQFSVHWKMFCESPALEKISACISRHKIKYVKNRISGTNKARHLIFVLFSLFWYALSMLYGLKTLFLIWNFGCRYLIYVSQESHLHFDE